MYPSKYEQTTNPENILGFLSERENLEYNTVINEYQLTNNRRRRFVYMDWPLDSDDISYINYKSLESIIATDLRLSRVEGSHHIPTHIEVSIIGQDVAYEYKIKHLLR